MPKVNDLVLDETPNDILIWQVDSTLYAFTKCCKHRPVRQQGYGSDYICGKCNKKLRCSADSEAGYLSPMSRGNEDLTRMWIWEWTSLKPGEFLLEVEW